MTYQNRGYYFCISEDPVQGNWIASPYSQGVGGWEEFDSEASARSWCKRKAAEYEARDGYESEDYAQAWPGGIER